MIPTFVFGWPTPNENGDFLALDLGSYFTLALHDNLLIFSILYWFTGGTNLRVCLVQLQGNGKFQITQTKYRLTEEQKQEEGTKLFDFCAECVASFVEEHTGEGPGYIPEGEEIPLGFTVRAFLS